MVFSLRSAEFAPRLAGLRALARTAPAVPQLIQSIQSQGLRLSDSARAELSSLDRESDASLLAEDLFAFASRRQGDGELQLAASVFQFLVETSPEGSSANRSGIHWGRRAQARLDALSGGGTFGERSETFLRHFARETSDPALLLGMGFAGAIFRVTRGVALAELSAARVTSPVLARGLAGLAGFAVEAPAFVLASRAVHGALGAPDRAGEQALGREILSSYLFLGAMKASGAVASALHRRVVGSAERLSGAARLSSRVLPQVGMLSGIMVGHRLEQWAGLRPAQDASSLLAESLATLLHFNVSGRVFQTMAGPRFRAWERAMDLRAETLPQRPIRLPAGLSLSQIATEPLLVEALPPGIEPLIRPSEPLKSSSIRPSEFPRAESGEEEVPGIAAGRPISATNNKASIRVGIGIDVSIPLLLEQFSKLSAGPDFDSMNIELSDGFARRVADWGYEWQETMAKRSALDMAVLRNIHDRLSNGSGPDAREKAFLGTLEKRAQDFAAEFEGHRQLLTKIVHQARRAPDYQGKPEDAVLDRVLHDLSHRSQPLQIMGLAAADLREGVPLDGFYLDQLHPKKGFMLGQTLKEAVAMSASESPELVSRTNQGLRLDGLDDFHLTQGRAAGRGLGDIVANLLTNAWRYRSHDQGEVRLKTQVMPAGDFEVSVRDNGIGIESQNLPNLGGHGYRESRKDLSSSHGFGLASVIETLRNLGWGPLWVRSQVGSGSEFRFVIPREYLLGTDDTGTPLSNPSVDRWGRGPRTELERQLDTGFIVPAASMDLALRQMLKEIPGSVFTLDDAPSGSGRRAEAMKNGEWRQRRLEVLHRLLAGGRPMEGLRVLENGPGVLPDLAFTLLRAGSSVVLKEPDTFALRGHTRNLSRLLTSEQVGRVNYFKPDRIEDPYPSDIVYWANPSPSELPRPAGVSLGEYFSRDVAQGGYLVLQTDHYSPLQDHYRRIEMDPAHWEQIFHEPLPDIKDASNHVLPTGQTGSFHLQIYRRRR